MLTMLRVALVAACLLIVGAMPAAAQQAAPAPVPVEQPVAFSLTADQIGATHRIPSPTALGMRPGSSTTRSSCSGRLNRPASVVAIACPGSCIAPRRNTYRLG